MAAGPQQRAGDLAPARFGLSGSWLSPELLAQMKKLEDAAQDPYDRLTLREKEVLQLIAQGKSNKEIAVLLDISEIVELTKTLPPCLQSLPRG